jgi:hypothetical protein
MLSMSLWMHSQTTIQPIVVTDVPFVDFTDAAIADMKRLRGSRRQPQLVLPSTPLQFALQVLEIAALAEP